MFSFSARRSPKTKEEEEMKKLLSSPSLKLSTLRFLFSSHFATYGVYKKKEFYTNARYYEIGCKSNSRSLTNVIPGRVFPFCCFPSFRCVFLPVYQPRSWGDLLRGREGRKFVLITLAISIPVWIRRSVEKKPSKEAMITETKESGPSSKTAGLRWWGKKKKKQLVGLRTNTHTDR